MGKGEIARYEQFLLFPQCFRKACFPGASKDVIVWEWVKVLSSLNTKYMSFSMAKWVLTHYQMTKFKRIADDKVRLK